MTSHAVVSGLLIGAIPIIQIGILYRMFWVPDHREVDRKHCECSCFDAVFKGSYEIKALKHGYKHIYFNATWQTMCVWIITVLYILLGYEAIKKFTSVVTSRSLRPVMGIVFCIGIYPHVFGWWALFNYYNDDFYPMFNHQVYFAITEIVSTYAILKSCDRNCERQQWLYGVIIGTASVHILVAGPEEFVINLLEGKAHQFWRDIGLASSDLLNIILPMADLLMNNTRLDQIGVTRFSFKSNFLTMSGRVKVVLIYCALILILGYLI